MLAAYRRHCIPIWQHWKPPAEQPEYLRPRNVRLDVPYEGPNFDWGGLLMGETYTELAWDLVEVFRDDPIAALGGGGGIGVVSMTGPSMMQTTQYHEHRFTDDWWEEQHQFWLAILGGGNALRTNLTDFKRRFPPDTLLIMYLIKLIGENYAEFHGLPEQPLTPQVAIEYLVAHRYIIWLDERDPQAVEKLSDNARYA